MKTNDLPAGAARIRPLGLAASLPYFALPALVAFLSLRMLYPELRNAGWSEIAAFYTCIFLPLALMLVASLVLVRREQGSLSIRTVLERFSFKPLKGKDWLWILTGLVVSIGGMVLLNFTLPLLAQLPGLGAPDYFPAILKPGSATDRLSAAVFLGVPLKGAWWIPLLHISLVLVFNIIGEEFWWRGYIWPRQEAALGGNTWWVHGLLWTLFHLGTTPWTVVSLLPGCLFWSLARQKSGNTTVVFITHLISNSIVLVPLIMGVLAV